MLPSTGYLVLAETLVTHPATTPAGAVDIVLSGNGTLFLQYWDSAGEDHYLYSGKALTGGQWHTITLQELVGAGSGSLALSVDGAQVISAPNLDTGNRWITCFALGMEYSPPDPGTSGHLYLDNVQTF